MLLMVYLEYVIREKASCDNKKYFYRILILKFFLLFFYSYINYRKL